MLVNSWLLFTLIMCYKPPFPHSTPGLWPLKRGGSEGSILNPGEHQTKVTIVIGVWIQLIGEQRNEECEHCANHAL